MNEWGDESSVRYPGEGWIARGTSQGFPGRHRTATNQNFSEFVTGNRDNLKYVFSFQSTDRVRSEARLLLLQRRRRRSFTTPCCCRGLKGP